jgi:hypothetical protein
MQTTAAAISQEMSLTQRQSQQVETTPTGVPTHSTVAPSGALVPTGDWFVETSYEPPENVTEEEVANLPDNDLLTGLKKQHRKTQRDLDAFLVFYDEAVRRFKEEQPRLEDGQFSCKDKARTLPEAFKAIGLNYETERKRQQRYLAAKNSWRTKSAKPPRYKEGTTVKDANSDEYVVLDQAGSQVDVVPEGHTLEESLTLPVNSLVRVPVKKISLKDLLYCEDNRKYYRYAGKGILKCSATPALLEHKHAREEKEIKAKQERLKAKIEEQQHHKALRKAEAVRRDLEQIAKAKAKNEAEANEKKAKKKTAGGNKPKTNPQLEAEAKQKANEKARKEAHEARTDAVAAQYGYGVDGNGKSVSDQKHLQ